MITYKCGCVNDVHEPGGVLRSISKCDRHRAKQRDVGTLDKAYYEELGSLVNGGIRTDNYLAELTDALGTFPLAGEPVRSPISEIESEPLAMEIGGGISPYFEAIRQAGYFYFGIEPSQYACRYMCEKFGLAPYGDGSTKPDYPGLMLRALFGEIPCKPEFSLVLAAHSLEHMQDAPGAIVQCADMLRPGGELWIIVPDDSDPTNPDHLFFFTEASLRSCVERAGLAIEQFAVRKHVPHERFLYCRAKKPA